MGATFSSEINVTGQLKLSGASTIESLSPYIDQKNSPQPVSINISSGQLILESDSQIRSLNHEDDPMGSNSIASLTIQSGEIDLEDNAFIGSFTSNLAMAGELLIDANSIILKNESFLGSYTYSNAGSGDIAINSNLIGLSDKSGIESGLDPSILYSDMDPFLPEDVGDIQITSENMTLEGGSFVSNSHIDTTLPGNISVASEKISLAGGSFISTESVPLYQSDFSNRTEVDQNGSVSIKTGSLDLSD